jgi:hypothetical protein
VAEQNGKNDYEQIPHIEPEILIADERGKPSKIIMLVSIIGMVLAITSFIFGASSLGLEAILMLTVIPLLLCLGLIIKKWWICGLLYCIVFLASRFNILFSGKIAPLVVAVVLIWLVLIVYATVLAYKFQMGDRK